MAGRRAFTLIELMAVVALLGLLAGATAWSMTGELRRATVEDAIGELRYLDQTARLTGRRFGTAYTLTYDLDAQRVRRIIAPGTPGEQFAGAYGLPAGVAVDRLIVADLVEGRRAGELGTRRRTIDAGEATIAFGSDARGMSYAVRVRDETGSRWLVFSGLSGQMTRIADDQAVDNLFASLGGGLDAD